MTDETTPQASSRATAPETGGTGLGHREVRLVRTAHGEFDVHNIRGGTIHIGTGEGADFTPVELLLAAIAGCSAVDVDYLTARKAEPLSFEVLSAGEKRTDDDGNHLGDIEVTFTLRFPEGAAGDKARDMVPRAIAASHDRLCTVSQTVQRGTPVTMREG